MKVKDYIAKECPNGCKVYDATYVSLNIWDYFGDCNDTVSGKVCDWLQEQINVAQVLDEREMRVDISSFVKKNRAKFHQFASECNGEDMLVNLTGEEDKGTAIKSVLNGVDTVHGLMNGDYDLTDYVRFAEIFGIDLTGCQ